MAAPRRVVVMDIDQAVRQGAELLCDAFVAGDVGRAIELFSPQLREHVGEVVSLLPLPMSEATIESIEQAVPASTSSCAWSAKRTTCSS